MLDLNTINEIKKLIDQGYSDYKIGKKLKHSPNTVKKYRNELNKIIVARLTGNGTKLRHLTRKEREKASLYMEEEAYLSDYWKYSDLEK